MIIVGIYTGFRPKELCLIEIENVNLDKMIIIGGMKTSNGKDRIVPIHPRIYPLIKTRLEEASPKLLYEYTGFYFDEDIIEE